MTRPAFLYEEPERFGESLTTARPWNQSALAGVELLNGRAAMVGFLAAILVEWFTGLSTIGQLSAVVHWYLALG